MADKVFYEVWPETPDAAMRRRARQNTPRAKLQRAAWDEANPDKRRATARQQADKKRAERQARVFTCATVLCGGTFRRLVRGSRRRYCDECRRVFGIVPRRAALTDGQSR